MALNDWRNFPRLAAATQKMDISGLLRWSEYAKSSATCDFLGACQYCNRPISRRNDSPDPGAAVNCNPGIDLVFRLLSKPLPNHVVKSTVDRFPLGEFSVLRVNNGD